MDAAYAYAAEGVHVDMVIRQNGNGPVWISYPWVSSMSIDHQCNHSLRHVLTDTYRSDRSLVERKDLSDFFLHAY